MSSATLIGDAIFLCVFADLVPNFNTQNVTQWRCTQAILPSQKMLRCGLISFGVTNYQATESDVTLHFRQKCKSRKIREFVSCNRYNLEITKSYDLQTQFLCAMLNSCQSYLLILILKASHYSGLPRIEIAERIKK